MSRRSISGTPMLMFVPLSSRVCFCFYFILFYFIVRGDCRRFTKITGTPVLKKCPVFYFSHVFIILCSCCQARIKSYFGDLIPRIVFYHSSPGLSAMERSSIGDGPEASPSTPGPTLSALQLTPVGTPRLHNAVPVFPFVVSFLFCRAGFDGFDGSI